MVTRWSFNIDGLDIENAVWELLLADARVNPPTYITIMDNKNFAKQWRREIPSTQVIYRTYDSADNYYYTTTTPQNAAIQLEKDHSDIRDCWQYYRNNEPGGEWRKFQDWIIRFAQEAKARGFKVTSGGLALGKNWHSPTEIADGLADVLLDYAIANEDTFLVDAHEYVTGTLWSPQIQSYPSSLFNRDLTLLNEQIPVSVDGYQGYQNFTNWGLFRICWLANARALSRHGKRLNVVINEGLFDFNAHIIEPPHDVSTLPNGQKVRTETEIRKYGEARFNTDVRGVLGSRKYFTWLVTGDINGSLSDDQYCNFIMRNFTWAEKWYPENVKGIMLFALNKDWELPEGHDYSPIIRTLLPKMRSLATNTTPDPTPAPTIETYTARIRSNTVGLRLRARPSAKPDSMILATLPQLVWFRAQVSKEVWQADGYSWRYLELYIDGKLWKGYAAEQYLSIETVEPEIDLSVAELELIMAFRERDYEAIVRLVDNASVVLLDETEQAILSAYDEKDVRKLLTFVLSVTP